MDISTSSPKKQFFEKFQTVIGDFQIDYLIQNWCRSPSNWKKPKETNSCWRKCCALSSKRLVIKPLTLFSLSWYLKGFCELKPIWTGWLVSLTNTECHSTLNLENFLVADFYLVSFQRLFKSYLIFSFLSFTIFLNAIRGIDFADFYPQP